MMNADGTSKPQRVHPLGVQWASHVYNLLSFELYGRIFLELIFFGIHGTDIAKTPCL